MKKKRNSLLFLFFSILFCLMLSPTAEGATLEVKKGGTFTSINDALQAAQPGDAIYVYPGTYTGQIVIDKSVSLIGVETPILDGGGEGDVISIRADGVTVKGFEIMGSGKKLQNSDAGIKCYSRGNVIEDNRITNNLFGIYLLKSPDNIIRRNLIIGRIAQNKLNQEESIEEKLQEYNKYEGYHPTFEGEGGDGIHLFAASHNLIENNVIIDTRDGIYFNYAHENRLINNRINGVRYAIHYMYSDDNYFEGNVSTNNVAGAAPMFSKRITFKHNVFAHNRGHRSFGVLFSSCNDCIAEENIIIDNTRGVLFDVSYHNIFRNNLLANNDIGIDLISSSGFNTITENNFIDNLEQIAFRAGRIGEGNVFHDNGKGNYWNDYRGFDLNRDGIGDTPYLTGDPFTYLMNKTPTVRLFLNSPAAKALEFAENMFPIIKIPKAEDLYPLVEPVKVEVEQFKVSDAQVTNRVFGVFSLTMLLLAGVIYLRVFLISSTGIKMWANIWRRGG